MPEPCSFPLLVIFEPIVTHWNLTDSGDQHSDKPDMWTFPENMQSYGAIR